MLKGYDELRKVDISKYIKKRGNSDYLPYASCIELLHANGAEKVYFTPVTNSSGSSLLMSDTVFTDKDGVTNRCYEVAVEIHIDDDVYYMQTPVLNGGNPVRDNSMNQSRVWAAQARAFVKGVAIYTGLGFDLWLDDGIIDEDESEDLSKHSIMKIKDRICQTITDKMNAGKSKDEIVKGVRLTDWDELKGIVTYCNQIARLEKSLREL